MASFMDKVSDFFGGNDSDTSDGLRSLFISELKGAYYAEKQAVDALGEQADAATTDEVRNAFLQHQEETRNQISRLERVFDSVNVEVDDKTCNAIDGLVEDAQEVVSSTESGSLTRDAGLIIAGQKIEHHEIAAYGSLQTLAKVLGYSEAAQLLGQTLEEEKATDKKLTQLAESFINQRASNESDTNNDNDQLTTDSNVGSTYQSGSAYTGGTTTGNASYGTGVNSGSGLGGSIGSGYSNDQNATLGGTLGV